MDVLLDTNILVQIFNQPSINLPNNANYFTFEKNKYEFIYRLKKCLIDSSFVIKCLDSLDGCFETNDLMEKFAYAIINNAYKDMPYHNYKALRKALKQYNLKYRLSISSEFEFRTNEDFINTGNRYCKDFDINDRETQLYFFYRHIYIEMQKYFKFIDDLLESNNINILSYYQVFASDMEGLALQKFIWDGIIPPEDLEIVLAALRIYGSLFLTCDRDLISCCSSLGLNHLTRFRLCDTKALQSDIKKHIFEYRKEFNLE